MITFLRDGSQDKVEVRIGECVGIWTNPEDASGDRDVGTSIQRAERRPCNQKQKTVCSGWKEHASSALNSVKVSMMQPSSRQDSQSK